MFGTIKNYLLAFLAIAVGLLAAVAAWYRGSLKSAQLKGSEDARKIEQDATEGMINDVEKENKVTGSIDDGKFLD